MGLRNLFARKGKEPAAPAGMSVDPNDPLGSATPGEDHVADAESKPRSLKGRLRGKEQEDNGMPTFLLVGSLSNVSRKIAESFARGQADAMLSSVELGRIYVYDDKERGRMIYEIHEGGPGFSIAQKVAEALETQVKVQIALANDRFVSIERTHDLLFSLLHNKDEASGIADETDVRDIAQFTGLTKLEQIYPDRNGLASLGGVLLGISLFAFLIAGTLHLVVKSGVTDPDALFSFTRTGVLSDAADNPAWQLDKARQAAEGQGKRLKVLRKDARGWNWEFQ